VLLAPLGNDRRLTRRVERGLGGSKKVSPILQVGFWDAHRLTQSWICPPQAKNMRALELQMGVPSITEANPFTTM